MKYTIIIYFYCFSKVILTKKIKGSSATFWETHNHSVGVFVDSWIFSSFDSYYHGIGI